MSETVRLLWKAVDAAMAILMAAIICIVFLNVVLRYGFASGLRSGIELSRLGFVWIVMLGAVACLRRGEHLSVPDFSRAFLPRAVPVLRRIIWAVVLISSVMLFWGAQKQTFANWSNISQLTRPAHGAHLSRGRRRWRDDGGHRHRAPDRGCRPRARRPHAVARVRAPE